VSVTAPAFASFHCEGHEQLWKLLADEFVQTNTASAWASSGESSAHRSPKHSALAAVRKILQRMAFSPDWISLFKRFPWQPISCSSMLR